MKRICLIFISAIFLWNCTEQQIALKFFDGDGPGVKMFGKNNQRTFSFNEDLGDSLQLLWRNETYGSYSNYSPIVFGEYMIVQDLSGYLTSFDKNTGKLLGKNNFDGEIATTPVLSLFKIFFTLNSLREESFILYSYDLVRSKILSEEILPGSCQNEMILLNEYLFLLSEEGKLYKFNDVGYQLDMLDTKTLSLSDLAADEKNIYWANQNGEIISVGQDDLAINYKKKVSESFETGFTLSNGFGFIGDRKGVVYKVRLSNGEIIWRYDTGNRIKCNIAVKDDMSYVGNVAGEFFAINKDGEQSYSLNLEGVLNTTPLIFNDAIVQPDLNEKVYIIEKDSGTITQVIPFERRVKMTPIYYDGVIYFGADRGQVYAYKLTGESE